MSLASDEIDAYRRSYIQALKPVFEETLAELVSLDDLTLSYYRGWDKDRDLLEVLASSLLRDQQMGHTRRDRSVRIFAYGWQVITPRRFSRAVSRSWWYAPCASPKAI